MKKEITVLDNIIITAIRDFIQQKQQDPKYKDIFKLNVILRENIFDVLERCCTAIYYPLNGEENDGFHVSIPVNYQTPPAHFVYLNTAKPVEKLVFVAGHELGHIWKIDQEICNLGYQVENTEDLINRFSAELLMPQMVFSNYAKHLLSQEIDSPDNNRFVNLLSVVALLMNEFCVPFQAIVLRLWECNQISKETVNLLLHGPDTMPDGMYADFLNRFLLVCKENDGYGRIGIITKKKSIPGFAQLLQVAEKSSAISDTQITALKELFDIQGSVKGAENFNDILKDL